MNEEELVSTMQAEIVYVMVDWGRVGNIEILCKLIVIGHKYNALSWLAWKYRMFERKELNFKCEKNESWLGWVR